MPKENEKQRLLTRRTVLFGGVQAAAFSVLAGRLLYLQFIKAEQYATLSENNRIKLQLIAPERGLILDCKGIPMATNEKNYRLFLDYSSLTKTSFQAMLDKLSSLIKLNDKKLKSLRATRPSPALRPDLIKEHLSWEEVSLVELHLLELPGISIDSGQIRHYPFVAQAAHLVGYVGTVAQEELTEDDPLLRLPDFRIGKNGIEKMLEDTLRGTAGIKQIEVNVHGVPVREIGSQASVPGEPARLTIDSRVQSTAAELVKDQSAAVIAMEVDTGNLLALVSLPGFDPDIFSKGITNDYWNELSADKKAPLMNKAITGQYPPGSTFKLMTGLAALEAGIINPRSTVHCPGQYYLGDHKFNCWKEGGHGTVNFESAIAQSCDTFFYTMGERLGISKYAKMARRFGLGESTGLGLTGEKGGIVPDPDWKLARYKERWSGGDTINCAIGQGYVLSTPLQLAVMTARMVNGGHAVTPRLFVPPGEEKPTFPSLGLSADSLRHACDAMSAVCNTQSGTAYGKRIAEPRFAMGGKTGTSQVRKILERGVNQNTIPWEYRHHALFIGYAPVDAPKYAVCVAIEHGGGGAAAAAPVARDVLLKIQQLAEEDAKQG